MIICESLFIVHDSGYLTELLGYRHVLKQT